MAKSLQDQLVAAGLASEKQKKSSGKKRKQPKARKKDRAQGTAAARDCRPDPIKVNAIAKAKRDKELNEKRQAELARRELVGQIRQLIESSRVEIKPGDAEYNFADGKTVKKLAMQPDMHAQLTAGHLAIAKLDGNHHLIPRAAAEKIVERDRSFIVVSNTDEEKDASDADDEYAEYVVPDDLMW